MHTSLQAHIINFEICKFKYLNKEFALWPIYFKLTEDWISVLVKVQNIVNLINKFCFE